MPSQTREQANSSLSLEDGWRAGFSQQNRGVDRGRQLPRAVLSKASGRAHAARQAGVVEDGGVYVVVDARN